MKESPQAKKLEEMLRSSKLVAGGFMGDDSRRLEDIIDDDAAQAAERGFTPAQIAARMKDITEQAIPLLGNWADIGPSLRARVEEAKGSLVCPWPHAGRFAKRITIVENTDTGRMLKWSDLNIHLIAEHGFFEGKGAAFRLEPAELIHMIFET